MRWLIGNWELKLVSFVVAVALWTYTSGQVRVEREILVELSPAQVGGLPSDLQVAAIEPSEFVVVLSVPTTKLSDLRDQVLRPQLALPRERRGPGEVEFPLTSRMLGLDSDIRILRTEPGEVRTLTIRLSSIASALVPTEPPAVVGLPGGIAAEVKLDRTRVQVRGPRVQVEQFESAGTPLRFAPVRIDGVDPALTTQREERVSLVPQDGQPQPVEAVVASVTIRPARTSTVSHRIPVSVLLGPADAGRWRVQGDPPQVEVRLTGPETVVRSLRSEDVVAWVDLHAAPIGPGERELPVLVQVPAGVTAEAGRISLTLIAVP